MNFCLTVTVLNIFAQQVLVLFSLFVWPRLLNVIACSLDHGGSSSTPGEVISSYKVYF